MGPRAFHVRPLCNDKAIAREMVRSKAFGLMGMDMVLHKPINPKALLRTISRAMALSLHRGRT